MTSQGQDRPTGRRLTGHRPLAAVLVLLLAVAATVTGALIERAHDNRKETIVQRFNTRHTTASRFIEAYLRQALAQQLRLAKQSLSGETIRAEDFDELARLNQLSSAGLYDGDGVQLTSYPRKPIRDDPAVGMDDSLRSALNGISAVTAVAPPGSAAPPLIAVSVVYQTPFGPRVFTSRYPVSDTLLQSFVANALPTYRTAHMYLVDSAETVIVADRRDGSGRPLEEVSPSLARVAGLPQGFLPQLHQYYIGGPIDGTNWQLIFSLSSKELYETLTQREIYAPWIALGCFVVLSLGMITLFVRALAGRTQAIDDHARQEAILNTTSDAFIGTDDTGRVTDWNLAAVRLLGWTTEEAIGQPAVALMFPPEDQEIFTEKLQRFLQTGIHTMPQPILATAVHREGYRIPVESTVARSHWQHRWRFHMFMRDVTERLENEKKLQAMALTDSLTGLANRRAFLEQLDQAHSRAQRHSSHLAVLFSDVDHFKAINDTYGHAAGDAVLRQVAARLRAHFRTEDTVGRLGGDEFAVICEDFTTDSEGMVERLRVVLAAPYSFRDQPIRASVSVGLATPAAGESSEQLLERADSTMYQAKAAR